MAEAADSHVYSPLSFYLLKSSAQTNLLRKQGGISMKHRMKQASRSLSITLTLALLAQIVVLASASPQTDMGRIVGSVRDQNKAVIQGASVTVKNERTGEERAVTTDEEGSFTAANLKPSTYTIKVSAQGFADSEIRGLQLL